MRTALAVIGANYGDEGKGLVTDYLSSKAPSLVVRFNGGAQAGHTVVTPDGHRHVFHHYGSGTLAGAHTFLSRFFIVNPIVFREEAAEVDRGFKFAHPNVFVDPRCLVTTPWDMMLNQAFERQRIRKHGSCGLGIHETIRRGNLLTYEDLIAPLHPKFQGIREFGERRAAQEGIKLPPEWEDPRLEARFIEDCEFLIEETRCRRWEDSAGLGDYQVIFEGAQGLALDMDNREDFPHLTHSNTGMLNVATLAKEWLIEKVDAHYVTRTYVTRHGLGPLPCETDKPPYPKAQDQTNVPNDFQGSLRWAYAEPARMLARIRNDLWKAPDIKVRTRLALTCVDQVGEEGVEFIEDGRRMNMTPRAYLDMLEHRAGQLKKSLICSGPTRNDVEVFQ